MLSQLLSTLSVRADLSGASLHASALRVDPSARAGTPMLQSCTSTTRVRMHASAFTPLHMNYLRMHRCVRQRDAPNPLTLDRVLSSDAFKMTCAVRVCDRRRRDGARSIAADCVSQTHRRTRAKRVAGAYNGPTLPSLYLCSQPPFSRPVWTCTE